MFTPEQKPTLVIPMGEFINEVTSDPESQAAADWIHDTKAEVLRGGRYPSREQLQRFRLTEANYLLIAGFISTVPGGAASPLADAILSEHVFYAEGREDRRHIAMIAMTHGSLVPTGREANQAVVDANYYIEGGVVNHLSLLHAETSCTDSQGDSKNTVRNFASNLRRFESRLEHSGTRSDISIHPIEAYTGARKRDTDGQPIFPLWNNDAFEVHDVTKIFYHPIKRYELTGAASLPEYWDRFIDGQLLNDFLRRLMDQGDFVCGIACLERGQGLANAPLADHNINLGDNPRTDWQHRGHSEAPIAILNISENRNLTALAWWLMVKSSGVIKRNFGSLTPTAPAIINFPKALLAWRSNPQAIMFLEQIGQLVPNLDRETYGATLMGNPRSHFYVMLRNEVVEVAYTPGLQLAHSEEFDHVYKFIGGKDFPLHSWPEWSWDGRNPNPKILLRLGRRPIGPVV